MSVAKLFIFKIILMIGFVFVVLAITIFNDETNKTECSAPCEDKGLQYKTYEPEIELINYGLEECWCKEQEGIKVYDREDEDEI